ncbi:uncharacterized protein LOC144143345 [Haemaphysalis longicornis]
MALASSFPCAALLLTLLCESRLAGASGLPERIWCVDSNCQEKIGEGIAVQDYRAIDENYVNFKRNDRVTVYGMGEDDVLHVEVGNQRGYVTASFVKIDKQFKKRADLVEGKIPGLSSEASSTDATEAVKATAEPMLTDAVPSSPITRSCNIHGTVMYGEFCDDVDATEEATDTSDDPTRLQASIDIPGALPYTGLPLFRAPNGAKPGSPVGEDTKLPLDGLPVASTTEMFDTNTTGVKAAAADEQGSSSEAVEVDSETLKDEGAVEEEEEEGEEAEEMPKPIPGEGDDDDDDGHVEEVTPDESDQVESSSAASKAVHTSFPSETSLDASPADEAAASTAATPPLEQPGAVDSTEGTSPTVSLEESSTSTSEASIAQETSHGYSQTADESKAAFSMSAELPEQHLDASSPLPFEQFSSMAAPDASPSASPVDESAVTSNTAMPSLEQQQSVPSASSEDASSATTEGLAASVETGPAESSADEPSSSISTTPLAQPPLSEQTASAQDVVLPALSSTAPLESEPASLAASTPVQAEEPVDSMAGQPYPLFSNVPQAKPQPADETSSIQDPSLASLSSIAHQESESSFLVASMSPQALPGESPASQSTASLSAPQAYLVDDLSTAVSQSVLQDSSSTAALPPLDAWSASTTVDEPLASATTAPFVEQPVAAPTVEDSSPTPSSVSLNQFQQEPLGSDYLGGSVPSNLVTQSLDPQQVHSAFSKEAPSSALPTSESDPAASLAPSTASLSESSAGGIGATETLDSHTTPSVPVGESLEPPPSLLPADGLAKPPGVPLPEKLTQPTEDEPSGFVMDWKVLEEYLWQVLALVPEPLQAALEWPLVPSLPLLMACCALLVFSLGASLHTAWLQRRKVSSLTGILSEREQELFTLKTERQVLSEQLAQAKKDSVGNDRSLCEQKRELETLHEEAKERSKKVDKLTGQLSEKVQQLESAQAALQQAQKLLQQRSTEAQERGDAAASLEEQLREACEERDRWQEQARESEAQEQMLRQSLTDATETSDRLWAELEALKRRQEELCEEVSASNRQADSVAEKLRQKEDRIQVLESSLEQLELLQKRWRTRKSENESENGAENEVDEEDSEEASQEEGRRHSELKELLDATQARRERDQAEEQCRQLQAQLDELREKLQSQGVQVESLRKELESSVAIKVESERKCAEAQTKLEVLTEYFKDREVQLQKEVGLQEFQRRQREADASTTAQQVSVLEQQCQSLQSQLDSLRQEMQLTERNYKNQVTDQEKRAHDNWLAARAAERKLEDANRELSSLRQRLTLAERELQQRPPLLPPPDMFPPPPLPPRPRSKDGEVSSLDGSVPPPPPPDMLVPPPPPLFGPFGMFGPFPPPPPPPPPELRKMMRSGGGRGSPGYFEDDDELGSPMPPPPTHHHHHYMAPPPREGRSSRTSRSSSASESRGRPIKSSPQSPLSDDRRNGTSGRSTPL